jgi:hypothetical protein
MKWIVVLAVASLAVAGCARPWSAGTEVAQEPVVAHCYITMADVECFAVPQPGQEYRLMGKRVTSPR